MSISPKPSILITGATGAVGGEIAKQLAALNIPFRALVRSTQNVKNLSSLPGAELIIGDLNEAESIRKALQGIERAFLLTNSSEQAELLQTQFVEVAKESGVKHIVKLSQYAADSNSPVRFLRYHAAVEQKIRESGMDYTFLRPNLFMQGLLSFREPIVRQGKFFASIGEAKVSIVDIRDIAAVGVQALTHTGHAGKIYTITGPEALTHHQMAAYLSEALGRPIQFIPVSSADMRQALLAVGFPTWQADGLIEDYEHYARGEASVLFSTVKEVTGHDPLSFKHFVQEYVPAFS